MKNATRLDFRLSAQPQFSSPDRSQSLSRQTHQTRLCQPYAEPGWQVATTFWGWQINNPVPNFETDDLPNWR